MSLAAAIAGAAQAAMGAIGDLKSVADAFMTSGEPTYDNATGTYTSSTLSDSSIDVLLYDFEANEIVSGKVFSSDQQLLVESRLLKNVVTPEWFIIDEIRWDVIQPLRVPGDSIRIYHVRKSGQ